MEEFRSWKSYINFRKDVLKSYRYIYSKEMSDFLTVVSETCSKRVFQLKKGTILWRAQLGSDYEKYNIDGEFIDNIPHPYSGCRMVPLLNQATEGRINPKGIPCLYLSDDMNTAMAEVRPWVGSLISVGQFEVNKNVKIIDCMKKTSKIKVYLEEPDANEKETEVWSFIDEAFSTPVNKSDNTAEYAPTQILAELFKSLGYDGIAYNSSLGDGHNVALFNINYAEILNCSLYEAKSVKFEFNETANPIFIKEKSKKK